MDYSDPVPSLVILVSTVLILSCRQTDRQIESVTDAAKRLTHANLVFVSIPSYYKRNTRISTGH